MSGYPGGIVNFLLARLAEDEAKARAALDGTPGRWQVHGGELEVEVLGALRWPADPDVMRGDWYAVCGWDDAALAQVRVPLASVLPTAEHIARHNPARVLAEVEAKRRIVCAVTDWLDTHPDEDHVPAGDDALCWLALPYADHPDYRQEWRP